jgi:hypothetical protein
VAAENLRGPFTLTRAGGERLSDRDFRCKLMLMYFGYTHCAGIRRRSFKSSTIRAGIPLRCFLRSADSSPTESANLRELMAQSPSR